VPLTVGVGKQTTNKGKVVMELGKTGEASVLKMIKSGKAVLVGEWRGVKPETINYVQKGSGKQASFSRLVHTVETGDSGTFESIKVEESVPDGQDPQKAAAKLTFQRGQQVICDVASIEVDKGHKTVRVSSLLGMAA
jgi:hypothetical protein